MSDNKENKTVYINNLSYKRDEKSLKKIFSEYGTVLEVKILVDNVTNQSKGMAFVEMSSVEAAQKAIEGLHGQVLDGRTVKVRYATPLKGKPKKFYLSPSKEEIEAKRAVKTAPSAPKPVKKVLKKTPQQTRKVKKKSGLEKMFENVKKKS